MATIDIAEYYPHAGLIWARAIDLLTPVVLDGALLWVWSSDPYGSLYRLQVQVNGGADDLHYSLYDLYQPAGEHYSFDYVFTLPGIRKAPPIFPKLGGSRNTLDFWDASATDMRKSFMADITGWSSTEIDATDYTTTGPATRYKGAVWTVKKAQHFGTDWILAQADNGSPPAGYVGAQPEAQGGPALAPVAVVGSGGQAVDLAPVVSALQDIALIDVSYTANNGGAVWSMRGRVAAE